MKKLIVVVGILVASIIACKKEVMQPICEEGMIIGRDYSKWLCGGGWLLQTQNGDTVLLYFANQFKEELSGLSEQSYPQEVCYTLKPLPMNNSCQEHSMDLEYLVLK